jgi:hypothetical protein
MPRKNKSELMAALDEIYCQHSGESIVYMWVEKAREFLVDQNLEDGQGQGQGQGDTEKSQNRDSETSLPPEESDTSLGHFNLGHNHKHHHHANGNHGNTTLQVFSGEPVVDRRSTFQAHLSPVQCLDQVKEALTVLKSNKKIETATHNVTAYRISGGPHNTCLQDCDDDGELHAGSRLLHLLQILDVRDVVVVVSRWYGGIQLGPDRFKHINNVARDLLSKCGFLEASEDAPSAAGRKKKAK